jgi:hypothetical protein
MKRFSELTSADFPGYDSDKISDWLIAMDDANGKYKVAVVILLVLFVILSIVAGTLVLPGILIILVVQILVFRRANRLKKELNLTGKIIKMARKGELTIRQ